jgi:signal transduction histidine kinase
VNVWSPQRREAALLAALAVAVAVDAATASHADHRLITAVVLVATMSAFALRRTRPDLMVAGFAVGYAACTLFLTPIQDFSATLPPIIIAGYSVGRHAGRAELHRSIVVLAALVVVVDVAGGTTTVGDFVFPSLLIGISMAVGRTLRNRALVAVELAERTERLSHERELRAAEAAYDERRRIARELHDVIAHTLSVMVVQAGGARRTLDRDPVLAAQALETVETTGRAALGELRRMLGFVGDGGAPTEPQPTLAQLPVLVTRACGAGLETELAVEGEPVPLPAGAEVTVYRIAQEALTNALKYAGPGARATVLLRWSPEAVELQVRDRGGGPAPEDPARLPSGGHGVAGMRERAALYGGDVVAGPRNDGFVVRARLPLAARTGVPA